MHNEIFTKITENFAIFKGNETNVKPKKQMLFLSVLGTDLSVWRHAQVCSSWLGHFDKEAGAQHNRLALLLEEPTSA
jgi:hypothetical protein